jgi:two-component system CheB/CheR fusion protein
VHRPLSDIVNDLDVSRTWKTTRLKCCAAGVLREAEWKPSTGAGTTCASCLTGQMENVIDGVVVTFINITESKLLEAQLRSMQTGTDMP